MWFKRIFKLVKVSFHFHHGLQIPDVPFSPKLLASLFCHNWIESTVSYLRTLLTNTLIFLLLGRWHWHLYQFTQTLFHSLYVSSLASELEILSQKQALVVTFVVHYEKLAPRLWIGVINQAQKWALIHWPSTEAGKVLLMKRSPWQPWAWDAKSTQLVISSLAPEPRWLGFYLAFFHKKDCNYLTFGMLLTVDYRSLLKDFLL